MHREYAQAEYGARQVVSMGPACGKCEVPGDSGPKMYGALSIPVREVLDVAMTREEREHRAAVLAAIDKRVAESGPHIAQPDDNRGRQFKPFAALKGFDELIREAERASSAR